jgi:hypothetical protein
MQPVHAVEYELTSELAMDIQRTLLRWELRRGWKRDAPVLLGALLFAALIIGLALQGWMLPGVGGGLLCLVVLFVLAAVFRRRSLSRAALVIPLLALHTTDRRVRVEFFEERVRLETELFRGEGAWIDLDDVVVFPRFWVLHLGNGGTIVVPGAVMLPELEALIRAKAQAVMAPLRHGRQAES